MSCSCEERDTVRFILFGLFLWFAGLCYVGAQAYATEHPIETWQFWVMFLLIYTPLAWFACSMWQIHQEEKGSK